MGMFQQAKFLYPKLNWTAYSQYFLAKWGIIIF